MEEKVKVKRELKTTKTRRPGKRSKSKYIGVTFHKRNGKWVSQASENGRSKYLGTYTSAMQAARVYDAYMVSRFGQETKTNFPKEEVDFTLVPVLKRYRKRDSTFDLTSFVSFPHNPLYPVEQAIFGDSKQFRDPNRPKNPRNAYMMFVAKQRELIKRGELNVPTPNNLGQTSKLFGRMWKQMDANDKKPFQDQAIADRVRFETESKSYVANLKKRSHAQSYHPILMQGMMMPGMVQPMMAPMQGMQHMQMQAQMQPQMQHHLPMQMKMQQFKQEIPSQIQTMSSMPSIQAMESMSIPPMPSMHMNNLENGN